MPVRQSAKAPSAAIDAPLSTARVQVWRHKSVVGIIRVYAPTPVDAYVLDADDLAVSRLRANERSNRNRRHEPSLSTSTMQAAAGCTAAAARCAVRRRRAPRAPRYKKHGKVAEVGTFLTPLLSF